MPAAMVKLSIVFLNVVALGFVCHSQASKELPSVSVEEARRMINTDSSVVVLDVRTPEEYSGPLGHIGGAILIPIQELENRINELQKYHGKTILAVCRTGRRSATATSILMKRGYRAMNVLGGMVGWREKNFDVEK